MSERSEPLLRHAPATFHGRFLVDVPPAPASPSCWLVGFHGYAQSAQIFMPLLTRATRSDAWLTAAVQAPHPFYTRGDRSIVANWMTREDRELAIPDNIGFVDSVLDQLHAEFGAPRAIAFLGFSQGAAMAYRAALCGKRRAAAVFSVCGDVPPDVRELPANRWPLVRMITGTADEWYPPTRMADEAAIVRAIGATVETSSFEGGHEFSDAAVQALGALLAQTEAAAR